MEERLQKYMASCGVASRRKCEEIILSGKITVNGVQVLELGTKIDPNIDRVEYEGNLITKEEKKVYIMLNKPEGYITSVKDEKGRDTVIDLIETEYRIFPIGRLDYDSSGLLLLTNDGQIYNKIIHPRVELNKIYIATVEGEFTKSEEEKFKKGVNIGDYTTAPANIRTISTEIGKSVVEITIHEGKNRQVRRMCAAFNHNVISLKRIQLGELKLGHLKRGEYRDLSNEELEYINSL